VAKRLLPGRKQTIGHPPGSCSFPLHLSSLTNLLFSTHLSSSVTLLGSMSTDKELYKLELLSLVARVSEELFNHTKLQDKTLAEYVIAVG
jgi:hypothetical protein